MNSNLMGKTLMALDLENPLHKLAYLLGKYDGYYDYAWMRDGVYYVGSVNTTLKEARAKLDKQMQEAIDEYEKDQANEQEN